MTPGALACALLFFLPPCSTPQPDRARFAVDPAYFLQVARERGRWEEPAEPLRIAGPIYFVGTRGLAAYLIATPEGHILINTGMPGSGPMIEASIRKLGLRPQDIRILLAGHAHLDHVGGHAYLRKLSGARVAMIREEAELLESGGRSDFQYGGVAAFHFEPVKVDRVYRDGEEIRLGGVAIRALLTPGHTRGSTTFVMEVDGRSVVFPNGTAINPGYRLGANASYPGIARDYRRTLDVLAALKPDIWLNAHTDSFDFEAKREQAGRKGVEAWVDPAGYRRWLLRHLSSYELALRREAP